MFVCARCNRFRRRFCKISSNTATSSIYIIILNGINKCHRNHHLAASFVFVFFNIFVSIFNGYGYLISCGEEKYALLDSSQSNVYITNQDVCKEKSSKNRILQTKCSWLNQPQYLNSYFVEISRQFLTIYNFEF